MKTYYVFTAKGDVVKVKCYSAEVARQYVMTFYHVTVTSVE